MHNNKKSAYFLVKLALMLLALFSAPYLHAAPLELNKVVDMSFGTVDFEGSTGSGNVTMGTNAVVTYGSNTSGGGVGTPGQLQISGDVGVVLSISCATSGNLALAGQTSLPVSPVRFIIGADNVTTYANSTECAGLGITVATHTIQADAPDNLIFIGGMLAINGQPLANGIYQTATSGGSLPAFQVIVQ